MKIAIVHDYLNQRGGAERVVGVLHRMFPDAPIYATILDRGRLWPDLHGAEIRTTWMQHLPGLRKHFKKYLVLYPWAIESLDLRAYDLVLSSSSAFAKAARRRPGALHVCYCHTPMRFAWHYTRYAEREGFGRLTRVGLRPVVRWLRRWDLRTASRPDYYIANSSAVAQRIRQSYGRDSEVLPPPVDLARFALSTAPADHYLVVSRLNGYKRIDLAVDAFSRSGLPLIVAGEGPQRAELERRAAANVRFVGAVSDAEVAQLYATSRALLLPGEEDFGITVLEANASGRPVIAFGAGGALDSVIDGETGVLFEHQTVASLQRGVERLEGLRWEPGRLRQHAERFGEEAFRTRYQATLERCLGHPIPIGPQEAGGAGGVRSEAPAARHSSS